MSARSARGKRGRVKEEEDGRTDGDKKRVVVRPSQFNRTDNERERRVQRREDAEVEKELVVPRTDAGADPGAVVILRRQHARKGHSVSSRRHPFRSRTKMKRRGKQDRTILSTHSPHILQ